MKLRTIGMAAVSALALIATRAQADDAAAPAAGGSGGWNTKYGMIFQASNIFQNSEFLTGYGGVGLQLNLAPQRAVRLTVNLGRTSSPISKIETFDGTTTTTIETVPTTTSTFDLDIGAQYMVRLTSSALAPYVGAGGGVSWASRYRDGQTKNSATPDVWTKYDWSDRTIGVGAVGTLGVEWRIHSMISIFAEYGLNIGLYQSVNNDDKTTESDGTITETKTTSSKFFNFDTALNQGGRLGLVAFF